MSNIGQVLATNRPLPLPPRAEVDPAPQQKGVDGPLNYEQIAELNAEIQRSVQPLPASAKKDGMDKAPEPGKEPGKEQVDAKPLEQDASKSEADKRMKEDNKKAIAELNKYSPLELMSMIRDGNIPDAIAENPNAMNALLARVQEFSRMIQMITNMMQVEHETLTSIIRNIKA